ncbi:MAG: PQQ-binding-like beta-propeller repeat protein [Gemmataceae bacterium]
MSHRLLVPLLGLMITLSVARADNWPAWRGPTGQGYVEEKNLPLKWSDTENVKWKVKLADQSNSTPVIWGDKIFLTQANKGGTVRSLICLSRANGEQLWKKDVAYEDKERNWNQSWYCNASPTTDGERVVVSFGSAGVYCYDFTGKELWKRTDLGKWEAAFGNSASPVIVGDLVVQWCGPNDDKGENYLLGMKKSNGETVWKKDEAYASWSTPVLTNVDGKEQLIVGYSRDVKSQPEAKWGSLHAYDPKTGSELWTCKGFSSYVYTSTLVKNGTAVGMSGYGGSAFAVKLGGTGDITKDRLWMQPKPASQRVGSGIILDEYVYMVDENGNAHCYDLKTGKDSWEGEKVKGLTWGSMIHSDGRLYLLMRNGDTHVLAAKPKFEVLATNSLGKGEQTNSSIAVSNGELFIRTFQHLYCISEKK